MNQRIATGGLALDMVGVLLIGFSARKGDTRVGEVEGGYLTFFEPDRFTIARWKFGWLILMLGFLVQGIALWVPPAPWD